jgi:pimeloyl-ACP methyl ester carboxylesterase
MSGAMRRRGHRALPARLSSTARLQLLAGRSPLPVLAAALLASLGLALALPPSSAQALALSPCAHAPGFSCATLTVPAVRAQPQLGSVGLRIEVKGRGAAPGRAAVVALAGGPGQPALPLAGYFASAMSPALSNRDLVVFDQRGVGESGPLACPALHSAIDALGALVEACGREIGATRSGYASAESVQDIEAIRQALGYEKLVLYGTSYGTKVALQYAQAYPSRVEALVLDSVVPPSGVEPLELPTIKAIGPVLSALCVQRACAGIASDPLAELALLVRRVRRRPLKGAVYDGAGRRRSASLPEEGLLEVLLAGDLNPALRAMTPAAVRSALRGDPAPLLRLKLLAEGLVPNLPGHPPVPDVALELDTSLLIDTTCEDTAYPWRRSSSPAGRIAEAEAALRAQPPSAFYPFDAATAASAGLLAGCVRWPYDTPLPSAAGPLPNVPTLILSGAEDLRTPTSGARKIAAQIPRAQLLVVPFTGHSVLGSDFSGCAKIAVEAFFEGAQILPCGPIPNLFSPTPAIPTRLRDLRGVRGLPLMAGRTLRAVIETMIDLDRQVIGATLQRQQRLPSGSSFGGLAGGFVRITTKAVRLHRFAFVPGVALTGVFPIRDGEVSPGTVTIGGAAAAHGHVRIGAGERIAGVLGGRRFLVNAGSASTAAAGHRRRWTGLAVNLLPHGIDFPLGPLARQR